MNNTRRWYRREATKAKRIVGCWRWCSCEQKKSSRDLLWMGIWIYFVYNLFCRESRSVVTPEQFENQFSARLLSRRLFAFFFHSIFVINVYQYLRQPKTEHILQKQKLHSWLLSLTRRRLIHRQMRHNMNNRKREKKKNVTINLRGR